VLDDLLTACPSVSVMLVPVVFETPAVSLAFSPALIPAPTPKPSIFASPLKFEPIFAPILRDALWAVLALSPLAIERESVSVFPLAVVCDSPPETPLLTEPPLIQLAPLPSEWLTDVESVSARLTV